ncbi:MAG: WD40 repeat domain-containing protein, partial [Gammaproteobacteria bacterium]|nr:WD40 repeat domain-containing protein [Gammaproteobacteria bacterium]
DAHGRIHRLDVDGTALGAPIDAHRGFVAALDTALRDGRTLLLSAGSDASSTAENGQVRLWSTDGDLLRELDTHTYGHITDVDFGPDRIIATRARELYPIHGQTAFVWSEHSEAGEALDAHPVSSTALAAGGNGTLAVGGDDGSIRLYPRIDDPHSEVTPPVTLVGHRTGSTITALAMDETGELLVSAGDDGSVRLWDTRSVPTRTLRSDNADQDPNLVQAWVSSTGRHAVTVEGHGPEDRLLLWTIDDAFATAHEQQTGDFAPVVLPLAAADNVLLGFSDQDRHLVTVQRTTTGNLMQIWSLPKVEPVALFEIGAHRPAGVAVDTSGARVATVDGGGRIRLWTTQTPEVARRIDTENASITAMEFSSSGDRLWLIDGRRDRLLVVELDDKRPTTTHHPLRPDTYWARLLPRAERLLTAHGEGLVLWRLPAEPGSAPEPLGPVIPLQGSVLPQVAQAAGLVLTVSPSHEVQSWTFDAKAGAVGFAHPGGITTLATSEDATLIATGFTADVPQGGGDSVVRLWDDTGRPLATLPWPGALVEALSITPDNRSLLGSALSSSAGSTLRVWPVAPDLWLTLACERLQGRLALPEALAPRARRDDLQA